MQGFRRIFIAVLLLLPLAATAAEAEWELRRDRDVLAHVIWQQDPGTLTVTMRSSATVDKMPEVDGRHRLVTSQMHRANPIR